MSDWWNLKFYHITAWRNTWWNLEFHYINIPILCLELTTRNNKYYICMTCSHITFLFKMARALWLEAMKILFLWPVVIKVKFCIKLLNTQSLTTIKIVLLWPVVIKSKFLHDRVVKSSRHETIKVRFYDQKSYKFYKCSA